MEVVEIPLGRKPLSIYNFIMFNGDIQMNKTWKFGKFTINLKKHKPSLIEIIAWLAVVSLICWLIWR